ncbi:cysteine desulfurase family protein [Clostridium boliviensis]|uniref:Cysteine desulfurase family protein n=1 Tax=Clostridium boliviensis TaxID=318465 RepID=A0ABU4GG18_9CLOT|nr:cysteine desulfurase family protein [Clostridium boliviensis]MDW2796564.1 cysteine desulfurase family protein [Clostridium boliviensis]
MIYADNAATTKLDIDAFEAMKPFMLDEYGNASQPYFFAKRPKMAIKEARKIIAECIGAKPEEIFFTSGGSESDNWAIKRFTTFASDIRHIITSNIEHHAVLHSVESEKMYSNAQVFYLNVDEKGVVNPEELESILKRDRTSIATSESTLISVMLANNEIGTIQPIKQLAAIAHNYGAIFHTDAVQAVGHIPINVKQLGVSMLSASAHKFNGPKGVGFLYSRSDLVNYIDGGNQERGLRAGTENVAGIVGMAVALKKNCIEMEAHEKKIRELEGLLIDKLNHSGLDYIRNGTNQLPGNISLSFANAEGEMLLHRMDLKKICISTGSACDSVNTRVSHVIKAIGVSRKYANGTIRISLGRNNTEDDVNSIAEAIVSILKG